MNYANKKSAFDTADDLVLYAYDINMAIRECNRILKLTRYPKVKCHFIKVKIILLFKKYLQYGS
jgi:hypothetical protein